MTSWDKHLLTLDLRMLVVQMAEVKDANTELLKDRVKRDAQIKELKDELYRQTQEVTRLEERAKQVRRPPYFISYCCKFCVTSYT